MSAGLTLSSSAVRSLPQEVNREHQAFLEAGKRAIEHAFRCGELLLEVKASVAHGEFLPWLEKHCAFSERTARNYMGFVKQVGNRQALADLSDDAYAKFLPAPDTKPHVANNSGDNEWYTPSEYIAAARVAMGGIDLDPASTKEANTVVKAERFYTADQNGLTHPWPGRVWLNPPYASEWIAAFAEKLVSEYRAKRMSAACVLVNNASETDWFEHMAAHASARCDLHSRVKFWAPDKSVGAPLQGQAVLYLGKSASRFTDAFAELGRVWLPA